MDSILCLSGGIDSLCAYHLLDEPKTIFFSYGDYSDIEKDVVLSIAPDTIIDYSLNFRGLSDEKSGYILYRNLLFAARAAAYLPNGGQVIMAGLKDDLVSDKNPEAFKMIETCLNKLDEREIKVISPFWEKTKAEVIKELLNLTTLEHGKQLLQKAFSCYHPINGKECLACPACFRKWNALWENEIKGVFFSKELMMDYMDSALNKKYDPDRCKSIVHSVTEYLDLERRMDRKTFCFDIDGVLTNETEDHDYRKRTPNVDNIAMLNRLYKKGNIIILNTARWYEDMNVTNSWLINHGVLYHRIEFNKPKADYYIDDKMITLSELDNYPFDIEKI